MSALCGFLNLDAAPADSQLVAAQVARLQHRGPDGSGTFTEGPCALGHLLLRITPEADGETSPFHSPDDQLVIAFDGRLDHREDLLAALGVPPSERGLPDPALILRAYAQWGADCVTRLDGEFAFAVWDRRRQELFCASDAFGSRPFYFYQDARRLVFASAIRGVLAVPGVPRELDELSLACSLGGAPQPPGQTLYARISFLPGGRTLTVPRGGRPVIRTWWQLTMEPEIQLRSTEDYTEALRELLERATRSAMRTRHPVGAMLSGGLDSSGVACLAARDLASRGQRLVTVSTVLPEDFQGVEWEKEESAFIRSALERYPNMAPHWARGLAFPVITFNDAAYQLHDEPDNDPKSFRTAELFRLAEQAGTRVLLGGMGGDMAASFKGTGYLQQLALGARWGELVRHLQLLARVRGETVPGIFRREVLRPLAPEWLRRWNDTFRHDAAATRDEFSIQPEFAARMQMAERRRAAGRDIERPADFRRLQVSLANAGLLGGGSGWASRHTPHMESPQPLMNRRLWEWCHRVPLGEFTRDGMSRGLYRRALHDVLPERILRRHSKGWFAPDYVQRLAACRPAMERFLAEHPAQDAVWNYVSRPQVEATLQRLAAAGTQARWDNRYQIILCQGLRLAHFVTWMRGR